MHTLGDFCYISKGMVVNAHENIEKGAFKKEDLISLDMDEIHSREYIEAKDMEPYYVNRVRYLEWNTERCPDKLSRPTFRELYDRPKILTNSIGKMQCTLDEDNHYLHNHSINSLVLWKDLHNVNNRSINQCVKKFSRYNRKEMEELSCSITLHYILGILNSKMGMSLLNDIRGGAFNVYPEFIRNIPIPMVNKDIQRNIFILVDRILALKKECPTANTYSLEQDIDRVVYHLYGLTYDEVLIIDPTPPFTQEEYEQDNL